MDDPTLTVDAPSKPRRRMQRTRIAVTVFFGLVAVGFAALWVWNYWCHDSTVVSRIEIHFVTHRIVYHLHSQPARENHLLRTRSIDDSSQYLASVQQIDNRWGFGSAKDWGTKVVITPHWFYVLMAGVIAAAPWIPIQFSLRAMLLATMLVAAVLGLICYTVR